MRAECSLGREVVEDAPDLTDLFVSIGGGGLMAGVATAIKGLVPGARLWGVETLGCHAMRLALDAGRPVEMQPSSIAKTLAAPWVSEGTLAAGREHLGEHVVRVLCGGNAPLGDITIWRKRFGV